MNAKNILATGLLLVSTSSYSFSSSNTENDEDPYKKYSNPRGCYIKRPSLNYAAVNYNTSTTALTIRFPSNSQGGKVEIYRNGVKVVSTSVPADASLCYVLGNYGKGDYTIIVSQGNKVVYSNNVIVK